MDAASWLGGKPILAPGDPALAGARCAVHGEVPATFTCSRCGSYACADCLLPTSLATGAELCRACARPVPWEDRRRLGWAKAYWQTTKMISAQPAEFFRTPATEGMASAIGFGTLSYVAGFVLLFVEVAIVCLVAGLATIAFDHDTAIGLFVMSGVMLIAVPLTVIQYAPWGLIACLLGGLISHGVLAVLKATKGSMEDSIRAVSYANAVFFWTWVPCVGLFVQLFWLPWIEAVGLRETHQCGIGPALAATYGYRVLIFGTFFLLYFALFGVMLASALPGLRQ